jgi:drug/metabolite transporter (DMT)-like permease
MTWLFFAILPPALYGITNFIDKFLVENTIEDPLVVTIFGGFINGLLGVIVLTLKGFAPISLPQVCLLLLAGVFLTFYIIPYFKALAIDDASRVIPLFQIASIFVLVLSYIFLGERLNSFELLGLIFIIMGGFILGTEKIESGIFKPRKSLYFMIISSLFYAITSIIFKFVVTKNDFWLTFGYESLGLGLGAFILLLWRPHRHRFIKELKIVTRKTWGVLLINEFFNTCAQFSTAYALLLASASLVALLEGSQPFFVLIYGLILSLWFPHIVKEDITKTTLIIKIICIILLFIGIYFVNK